MTHFQVAAVASLLTVHVLAWSADTQPQPVGQSGAWRLVFSDEFDGASLDAKKWRPNWLGPDDKVITKPVNTEELSCYDPKQVQVAGGELRLVAESRACVDMRGDTRNFASGLVQTDRRFNFTYGFAEARMWMPKGAGVWPAFWLNGQKNPEDGEIDVVEASGDDAGRFHFHYRCKVNQRCAPGGNVPIQGATSGWHTYAVQWTPTSMQWFYDGKKVYERNEDVPASPHYIILNLGLRKGTADIPLPAALRVDYVRVWQQN